jgi:glutathione reductase (NADPH)
MDKPYDAVMIGTGTTGTVIAQRLRAAGWHVAICDSKRFGGTCALRGCDPKKVLVQAAMSSDHARRMQGKGVSGQIVIDWAELMVFKRRFTEPVPDKREQSYADQGIDAFHGEAHFIGKNALEVGGTVLEAKHIVIASGAEPVRLGISGEEHLVTSEQFLSLDMLPKRIVMVGGGYIAAEFASTVARAGVHVVVLQHGESMLGQFDHDLVRWLMDGFKEQGIEVHTGISVGKIEKSSTGYRVYGNGKGEAEDKGVNFEADLVVHAAGRKPAVDTLHLDAAEIAVDNGRLQLNEFLQSISNPAVYAAGDAAQMGPPLTPVASHDAKVVVANLLNGNHAKPNYLGVPSVAFTIPPIAAVGLNEVKARSQDRKFRVKCENTAGWFTARQENASVYGYKVLVDEETDQILGAHLVGPHVDQVINLFALAIRHGLTAEDLKTTMFAYPTGASDIGNML